MVKYGDIVVCVTTQDIEEGIPRKVDCCAIARAFRRTLNQKLNKELTESEIEVFDGASLQFGSLVYEVILQSERNEINKFIDDFDSHRQVLPFCFSIQLHEDEPSDWEY